jgi:hypothetical protein
MDAPLCPYHACTQLKPLSEFNLRDRYAVPRPTRWSEYLSSCRIHPSAPVTLEQAIFRGVRRRRRMVGTRSMKTPTAEGQPFLDS